MCDTAIKIFQITPSIIKFCGNQKGQPRVNVESFVKSIELYLEKENYGPERQYVEACGFLDLSKGDLSNYLKSGSFHNCRAWDNLKAMLKWLCSLGVTNDPVMQLCNSLNLASHDPSDNFVVHCAQTFDQLSVLSLC